MRRATENLSSRLPDWSFQSTLSMRRATQSIMASFGAFDISIHALHEESDFSSSMVCSRGRLFQSTLSMRRATDSPCDSRHRRYISIHALHEESDPSLMACASACPFQSTLSMRRATGSCLRLAVQCLFQSTLSMRRATEGLLRAGRQTGISIHALHEESDTLFL